MADLKSIAESTTSTVTARLITVSLPFLIAVIGWFAIDKLNSINESQGKMWSYVGEIRGTVGDIKTSVAVGNAAFNAHVKDDDGFETTVRAAIADHEQRLRAVVSPIKP